ncbi:MAG TPA: hypothetical protein VGR35_15175 [Tepidisphaeraceae bacterium]|nr:hypothetical protein [Tepidisphaeraceae bacterium]
MSHSPRYRTLNWSIFTACLFALALALAAGCSGRPSLVPNSDKALRKSSAQFSSDAAKRYPYKADAPRAGQDIARAQVGYTMNQLEVANLSDDPWRDVEVWVNGKYVVFVPQIKPKELKVLNFQMLFDDKGNYFPVNNKTVRVNRVEVLRDGQMWDVPVALAD